MAHPDAGGRWPDFDSWHPWALDADHAVDIALACEAAGRDVDPRIGNSDGASVGSGESLSVYANSHGFTGAERGTHHSIGCALIAGEGDGMQRDGWYTSALAEGDLEAPVAVGRHAAQRTLSRLDSRPLATGGIRCCSRRKSRARSSGICSVRCRVARCTGAPVSARQRGQPLFRTGSRSSRGRGCTRLRSARSMPKAWPRESPLVAGGVLQRYVLGSYSARRLGLRSTANAGGVHNLEIAANAGTFANWYRPAPDAGGDRVDGAGRERGDRRLFARRFGVLVENGEIAYPVDGITIAGNLKAMFAGIEAAGSDVDPRSHIRTGSILVGKMTVAGSA